MAPLFLQSSVDYAKTLLPATPFSLQSSMDYAKTLLPETLVRSVYSVQTTISQRIMPAARPRIFRVTTATHKRHTAIAASSLDGLLDQASQAFLLTSELLTLVLDEDGTQVDTEDFFQSLSDDTSVAVLQEGETWTGSKVRPSFQQHCRCGIAKLTFDLYKQKPRDFLGCLTVKATLYDIYNMSVDFRCKRAKQFLKVILHYVTQAGYMAGRLLLFASASLLEAIGEDD